MPFMRCVISLLNGCIESPYQTAVAYRASETHATSRASLMTLKKISMKMAYQIAATTFSFYPMTRQRQTAQNESQSEPSQHLSANNVYHVEARQVSQDQKQKEKSASATPFRHCCTIPKRRQSPNQPTNRRRIPYAQEPDRTHRERERNSKSDSLRKANEEIEKEFDEPIKKSLCTNSKERERENTQQKNKR